VEEANKLADFFMDALHLVARWKQQTYLDMTDDELLETLEPYGPEFAAAVYRMIGER